MGPLFTLLDAIYASSSFPSSSVASFMVESPSQSHFWNWIWLEVEEEERNRPRKLKKEGGKQDRKGDGKKETKVTRPDQRPILESPLETKMSLFPLRQIRSGSKIRGRKSLYGAFWLSNFVVQLLYNCWMTFRYLTKISRPKTLHLMPKVLGIVYFHVSVYMFRSKPCWTAKVVQQLYNSCTTVSRMLDSQNAPLTLRTCIERNPSLIHFTSPSLLKMYQNTSTSKTIVNQAIVFVTYRNSSSDDLIVFVLFFTLSNVPSLFLLLSPHVKETKGSWIRAREKGAPLWNRAKATHLNIHNKRRRGRGQKDEEGDLFFCLSLSLASKSRA